MPKRYWFFGLQGLALLMLFALATSQMQAQEKFLPTLSLQKAVATNTPQGSVTNGSEIFVSEPGFGEKRYLIMPVFVFNCLDTLTSENDLGYPGEPLYSFKFQMQYNDCMLKAVGVSKRGVLPQHDAVLAEQFNFSWDVADEPSYKRPTTGGNSAFGSRINVTASSSLPLPLSPVPGFVPGGPTCNDRVYTPLIYVVFEVVGDAQGGACGITSDQVILVRDSIQWNNYRPSDVTQTMLDRGFGPVQVGVFPRPIFPITFPNDYGSAIVTITRRPRIDLQPSSQVVLTTPTDDSNYELVLPMQTQFGNNNYVFRQLLLLNGIAGSFLRNVTVETNAPWLRVDTNNPFTQGVGQGERELIIPNVGAQQFFNLVANPAMLPAPPNGYPTPGLYEGYVTIRSVDAQNSSVRLKVLLVVNRNPLEPTLNSDQEPTQTDGIRLLFRNSAPVGPDRDTTYLTFGTGIGATDGVDTLFGELEAAAPPVAGNFYARFFPPSLTGFNGMIDARGLYTSINSVPKATTDPPEASLDIRNFNASTIHTYCVNFDAGDPSYYPVVIEYDLNLIPQGAQLFFKQNVGGVEQVLDMRTEGARIGATRRAIFIQDPSVKGFCIDYLLPQVIQFPEINQGWNFVSLPVDPSDPDPNVVFRNSISGAIQFTSAQYSKEETQVRPGIGYFVKYGAGAKDRTVSGAPVFLIDEPTTPYDVRVFEGWNAVGALAVPTEVSMIGFTSFEGNPIPSLVGEVYRYVTSRGYEQVSRIDPGFGYWINVSGDGYYQLKPLPSGKAVTGSATVREFTRLNNLVISDNGQHESTQLWFGQGRLEDGRYEMPPTPPIELFDVRFNNNGFVSSSTENEAEHIVDLQGVSYPVVLSVANVDATYILTDAETGAYLGEFRAGSASAVTISNPMVKSVRLTRVASSSVNLTEAFPNPTNDKLNFSFAVPGEREVSVALYNSLGEKVADLYEGTVSDGRAVEFSTRGLDNGVYVYKMTTSSGETVLRHVVVTR